jgi:hypothetical protein
MAGTGFHSFVVNCAPILQFSTTGMTPWQTTLKSTAVWHYRNNPLAICSQILRLTLAIRGTIIFFVAIRITIIFFMTICGQNNCYAMVSITHLTAVFSNLSEIQYQLFDIDSPPVRGALSF